MKCSFCNIEIEKGTGKMYIKNDAKVLYFCSKRCEKNLMKLKRDPARVKWIVKKK
ncbi:MAG: 50S ribosomal protein L24e [Candidatus Aenigmarchaeota archaeon]|nr:50S ribosomal protein L24e [Candidatus Aenigmarchaeota archaeon]